jgi:hypothetical protein
MLNVTSSLEVSLSFFSISLLVGGVDSFGSWIRVCLSLEVVDSQLLDLL